MISPHNERGSPWIPPRVQSRSMHLPSHLRTGSCDENSERPPTPSRASCLRNSTWRRLWACWASPSSGCTRPDQWAGDCDRGQRSGGCGPARQGVGGGLVETERVGGHLGALAPHALSSAADGGSRRFLRTPHQGVHPPLAGAGSHRYSRSSQTTGLLDRRGSTPARCAPSPPCGGPLVRRSAGTSAPRAQRTESSAASAPG